MWQLAHIPDSEEIILARDNMPDQALRITDIRDLLALRKRIEEYIYDQKPDSTIGPGHPLMGIRYIHTAEAIQLAAEQGLDVPRTTLNSALHYGNIEGARKRGGRWEMPEWGFLAWLEHWQARTGEP